MVVVACAVATFLVVVTPVSIELVLPFVVTPFLVTSYPATTSILPLEVLD